MSEYHRILDARSLTASMTQNREEVWDAGAYRELQLHFRVIKAGSAGTLSLEHALVNEEDAYEALGTASITLGSTGSAVVSISNFFRYLRCVTDGAVAGSPVAIIDGIAKGS